MADLGLRSVRTVPLLVRGVTAMTGAKARPRPCASCPYRQGVPSGVWDESEYVKLPAYDGDTASQSPAVFLCHQQDGSVCSGWLGHREPYDLLAVRLGVMTGLLDPSCMDYKTDVPLFATGTEAAAHGMRDFENPGEDAEETMRKIVTKRSVVGDGFPVYCNTCGGTDGRHSYHCHNDR